MEFEEHVQPTMFGRGIEGAKSRKPLMPFSEEKQRSRTPYKRLTDNET